MELVECGSGLKNLFFFFNVLMFFEQMLEHQLFLPCLSLLLPTFLVNNFIFCYYSVIQYSVSIQHRIIYSALQMDSLPSESLG